jgi:hypothetical protein
VFCFESFFSNLFYLKVYKRLGRCPPIAQDAEFLIFRYFSKHTSVQIDGGHLLFWVQE